MVRAVVRRIQKVGNASYSVIVPKSWVKKSGIKPQDLITIEESDDLLIIRPAMPKSPQANMSLDILVDNNSLDLATREVLSAYLDGCMTINVLSREEQMTPDFIQRLKQSVLELTIGLEVVDESRAGITFQEIFSKPVMNFNGIANRMYRIALEMLKMSINAVTEGSKEDAESVIRADVDVDKFYLYGIRTLNLAINDKPLMDEMGIERPEETLVLKSILKSIERIADHAVSISKLVTGRIRINGGFSEEIGMKAVKIFDMVFESLITMDEIKANSLIAGNRSYVEEISKAPYSMLTEHLVRIAEYSSDICENVIDLKVSRKIQR
ncbi:MAG: phosphate uptake regulator PhoU [Nitrososphaerota archaeon]|jgi:phosphate uptake regulator|nr:phosphate uptake regulator PhoU [Nitrososphaerota archaeon]MDG6931254.1 phosphate uptake regulator PhoU [Nitrososphaerota archaeon]